MKSKEFYTKLSLICLVIVICISAMIVWNISPNNYRYLLSTRLPKIVAIILVSICIGVSSLIFQTISQSRILTPNVMGLDSMYVFIQTSVSFFYGSLIASIAKPIPKFIITTLCMILISLLIQYIFSGKNKIKIYNMVLIGMIMGTFLESISNAMQLSMDPNEFLILQGSLFPSFSKVDTNILMLCVVICIVSLLFLYKDVNTLDIISLGYESSVNLGVDYNRFIKKLLLIVSILISISTALIGPITFLGLLTINITKEVFKTYRHAYLVPASVCTTILTVIIGQILVERVFSNSMSINIIINFFGGIYLLIMILKNSSGKGNVV